MVCVVCVCVVCAEHPAAGQPDEQCGPVVPGCDGPPGHERPAGTALTPTLLGLVPVPFTEGRPSPVLIANAMRISLEPLSSSPFWVSKGEDQNASRYNWIDLQQPIGAKRRVTQQRQLSWLFMKLPEPCCHRALLCLGIKPDPY